VEKRRTRRASGWMLATARRQPREPASTSRATRGGGTVEAARTRSRATRSIRLGRYSPTPRHLLAESRCGRSRGGGGLAARSKPPLTAPSLSLLACAPLAPCSSSYWYGGVGVHLGRLPRPLPTPLPRPLPRPLLSLGVMCSRCLLRDVLSVLASTCRLVLCCINMPSRLAYSMVYSCAWM
jgi:hypothetical protein